MKFKLIHSRPCTRLILIFAGWGMDNRPFESLACEGYDIALAWDYRDPNAPWADRLASYAEIAVFAWSFGVPAASHFIGSHPGLPVTARIAVNGTMHPVDDRLGIPTEIFEGTLSALDERNLAKFYRRMCGGGAAFRLFAENLPARGTDELKEELRAIASRPYCRQTVWDRAIVSDGDLIIPPENQRRAWASEAFETMDIEGPHLPDFATLLASYLTDKALVERKFRGAAATYEDNAPVQREIADRLLSFAGPGGRILEIGAGTGYATSRLARTGRVEAWDLALSPTVDRMVAEGTITAKSCDAETEIRQVADGSFDLLFSASTVQWFNSLPAFLREAERVLAPGGNALISTFGPRTMGEIHSIAGTAPLFPSAEAIRRMMPDAEVREDEIRTYFATPADVLRHVRLTGTNSLGSAPSPAVTRRILGSYPLTPDGKVPLTYNPIYITLRKPQ